MCFPFIVATLPTQTKQHGYTFKIALSAKMN